MNGLSPIRSLHSGQTTSANQRDPQKWGSFCVTKLSSCITDQPALDCRYEAERFGPRKETMARDWDYNDEEFTSAGFYGNLGIDSDTLETESPAEIARREDAEFEARQIAAEDADHEEDEVSDYREMQDYYDVD